jgi:hypothetical protein
MKHPRNKGFGKGSISEQLGYVCIVQFDIDNKDRTGIFFDFEHSYCELYLPDKS